MAKSKASKSSGKPEISWQQTLSKLNPNTVHPARLCEIILMSELTPKFSDIVTNFNDAAKLNPDSVCKSICYADFINDVKQLTQPGNDNKFKCNPWNSVHKKAATEALQYLNKENVLHLRLMAELLKLQIINVIFEDVALIEEQKNSEPKRTESGKTNNKNGEKKNKTKAKIKNGVSKVDIRKLYIVINGFQDPELIKELYEVEVELAAILEIATVDEVFQERWQVPEVANKTSLSTLSASIGTDSTDLAIFINKERESGGSSFASTFIPETELQLPTEKTGDQKDTSEILYNFWKETYRMLEGDLQAKCLEDTIHIRIPFCCEELVDATDEGYPMQASNIFLKILGKLGKLNEIRKQHVKYLKELKIYHIDSNPVEISIDKLKTYNKLLNVTPPDCFTIELFLSCLVEEVSSYKDYYENDKIEPEASTCEDKASLIGAREDISVRINEKPVNVGELYSQKESSTEDVANYVIKYRKSNWPHYRTNVFQHQLPQEKINLKLSREPFVVHNQDKLSLKFNCYKEIASELLKTNLDILKICYPAILWQLHEHIESIEVVLKTQQLQTWCHLLKMSETDLKCGINTLLFDNLPCNNAASKPLDCVSNSCTLFRPKNEEDQRRKMQVYVTYVPTPLNSENSYIGECTEAERAAEGSYAYLPNIFECRNMHAYKWYEMFSSSVMLQELQKACLDYLCVDNKFCPFDDTILLRFHNDTDEFGINVNIWNRSTIRTPVCVRDFCKYVIHEETEWFQATDSKVVKVPSFNTETLEAQPKNSPTGPPKVNESLGEKLEKSSTALDNGSSQSDQCYNFVAYDINQKRTQLTGGTITFHSLDGYKITIDKTTFLGDPNQLSLNVAIKYHNFNLHFNENTSKTLLMFHFNMANDVVLAFQKAAQKKPEINIVEKVYKNFKPKQTIKPNSAYQRRKKIFYVLENHRCVIKTLNLSFASSSSLILSCSCNRNESSCIKSTNEHSQNNVATSACLSKQELLSIDQDLDKFKLNLANPLTQPKLAHNCQSKRSFLQRECVLEKIENAKTNQVPLYTVLSSKLHKFDYMKRKKSTISIKIGNSTIKLLCAHPSYKISKRITSFKLFPVKLSEIVASNNVIKFYDMTMSLPSGLMISTSSSDNLPCTFKQGYIEKGPQCKMLANEYSRTFTHDGNIIIKKCDGTMDILCKDGFVIHCEIPYSSTRTKIKHMASGKGGNSLKKKIQHRLSRWYRHLIGGKETLHFKHLRTLKHLDKIQNKNRTQLYVFRKTKNTSLEFTVITQSGNTMNFTANGVKERGKIYQATLVDNRYNEELHIRDDGVKSLLDSNGVVTTQFLDKTRISSWFTESSKLLYIVEDESASQMSMKSGSFQSFEYFLPFNDRLSSEGWIVVEMFYKFEHPNYATVLYNNLNSFSELILPNDVSVTITDRGKYLVNMDKLTFACINDESIYLETIPCESCMKPTTVTINIKPLYDQMFPIPENTELVNTYDSYEKIFFVHYNGRCFRNANFIRNGTNNVGCRTHQQTETQKLFVLNRDLSGKKLWDFKSYHKRITEARKAENTTLQYYNNKNTTSSESNNCNASAEVRTYEFRPPYEKYMMPYVLPDVNLLNYIPKQENPPLVYTIILRLHAMPEIILLQPFQQEISAACKKDVGLPKSNGPEICRFINNLVVDHKYFCENSQSEFESALSQCERWYKSYNSNDQQRPWASTSFCSCSLKKTSEVVKEKSKSESLQVEVESLEMIPRKFSSSSSKSNERHPKIFCQCYKPARFMCDCKAKEQTLLTNGATQSSASNSIHEKEGNMEEEEELDQSPMFSSFSICGCSKLCTTLSTLEKRKESANKRKSKNSRRYRGGQDPSSSFINQNVGSKKQEWTSFVRRLLTTVVELVMSSKNATRFTCNDEKYKTTIASSIIYIILKAQLNTAQVIKLLERLEHLVIARQDGTNVSVSCDELSNVILSEISLYCKNQS